MWALMDDNRAIILEDGQDIDVMFALGICISGDMIAIDHDGECVGGAWFGDETPEASTGLQPLHRTLHLLVEPRYWRYVLKQGILEQILDHAFKKWPIGKIKAEPNSTQKHAMRLLKRVKFKQVAVLYKDTYVNGVKTDRHLFELRRKYWETYRQK